MIAFLTALGLALRDLMAGRHQRCRYPGMTDQADLERIQAAVSKQVQG